MRPSNKGSDAPISCLLGLDLRRKPPLTDLTPEEPPSLESEEAEAEAPRRWVIYDASGWGDA